MTDRVPPLDPAREAVLEGLNPSQRAAVSAPAGPVLVFAGAGSGKTRVITRRIAWLTASEGAPPGSILAVTFTNKAAREMRSRVDALRPETGHGGSRGPWVSTFHAFALALLRRFSAAAGLPSGFAVLGTDDRRRLLKRVVRELTLDEKRNPVRMLDSQVSALRNAEAAGTVWDGPRLPERRRVVERVTEAYEEALGALGAVDFDDLQIRALALLRGDGDCRRFVERRARRLLVDEYQDTSPIQHRLLLALAPHRDVFAVGDDDQSIYSFRGADYRNILRFETDFPGARVYRLEQNYRSTAAILDAANAVISKNRDRAAKTLRPTADRGAPVTFGVHPTEQEEARAIADKIVGRRGSPDSTAVLVRTRAQTRALEEAFTARGIRHFVIGGLRFYERREVLDAIAWVRLGVRGADDASFGRAVASPPRGIGSKSLERIREAAAGLGVPLLEASRRLARAETFRGRTATGLRSFLAAVAAVHEASRNGPEAAVETAITASGLAAALADDQERTENLASLRAAARESQFERGETDAGQEQVLAFLDQVSLLAAEDLTPQDSDAESEPPVLVMTVHAAKGLEFDRVFLAGLWEGLFPHSLALDSAAELEEERRLFYVGMTRARKELLLSAAPGATAFRPRGGDVSRFVADIPGLVATGGTRGRTPGARRGRGASVAGFRRGQQVSHPRFGVGRVEWVDVGAHRITVVFPGWGRKRLVPEYARLQPVR